MTLIAKLAEMKQGNNVTRSEIGFLKGDKNMSSPAEKIVLTSYPRSGNTLIRTYLEKLTRIYTGSDCDVRSPAHLYNLSVRVSRNTHFVSSLLWPGLAC